MQDEVTSLVRRIDGARMRELLVDFANCQSASDRSLGAAEWFAGLLRASGAVEAGVRGDGLAAPAVVAGFPGRHRSPTLQFMGYFAQPGPARRRAFAAADHVYGRAVASGAAGLIAAAEAARVLAAHGPMPGGGLLFLARPCGDSWEAAADLSHLMRRGILGQGAVITGGAWRAVPVVGMGSCMFQVVFSLLEDQGSPCDLQATALDAAHRFCSLLRRRQRVLAREPDPLAGAETIVVGRMGGGEQFDVAPSSSWVQGTWRFGPGRREQALRAELADLAGRAAATSAATVTVTTRVVREPFRLDHALPLIRGLQAGYRAAWGNDLPEGSCASPTDVPLFLGHGVPAVCHGPRATTMRAGGGEECVSMADLVRLAEVYVRLSLSFLGAGQEADTTRQPQPASPRPFQFTGATQPGPVGYGLPA